MAKQETYKSVIIREYLWNCGDVQEMREAFNHFAEMNEDDVDFNDYVQVIWMIEKFVPNKLIKRFDSLGDKKEKFIDEYEEKIINIFRKKLVSLQKQLKTI